MLRFLFLITRGVEREGIFLSMSGWSVCEVCEGTWFDCWVRNLTVIFLTIKLVLHHVEDADLIDGLLSLIRLLSKERLGLSLDHTAKVGMISLLRIEEWCHEVLELSDLPLKKSLYLICLCQELILFLRETFDLSLGLNHLKVDPVQLILLLFLLPWFWASLKQIARIDDGLSILQNLSGLYNFRGWVTCLLNYYLESRAVSVPNPWERGLRSIIVI